MDGEGGVSEMTELSPGGQATAMLAAGLPSGMVAAVCFQVAAAAAAETAVLLTGTPSASRLERLLNEEGGGEAVE